MRMIVLVIGFVAGLIAPGFAQQTEIEAVNAKWLDFFNKGDFAGVPGWAHYEHILIALTALIALGP
jgi:hypothetical protein